MQHNFKVAPVSLKLKSVTFMSQFTFERPKKVVFEKGFKSMLLHIFNTFKNK